jgi:hypothetical protein
MASEVETAFRDAFLVNPACSGLTLTYRQGTREDKVAFDAINP